MTVKKKRIRITKKMKLQYFESLAVARVNATIKKIRLIGNLANAHNCESTPEHHKQILNTLRKEIDKLEKRFMEKLNKQPYEFKFTDISTHIIKKPATKTAP